MKYLIFGLDSYRALFFIRSLIPEKPRFIDTTDNFESEILKLDQLGLFSQGQLTVLRNILKQLNNHVNLLVKTRHNIVIWEETAQLSLSKRPKEKLLKTFQTKEFKPLSTGQTIRWLNEQAAQRKIKLNDIIIKKLIELHGSDLFLLENELEKIYLYLLDEENNKITLDDLEKLTQKSVAENIFVLLDHIGERNLSGVRRSLAGLLNQQMDDWYLFYLVVRHLRLLYQVKLGMPLRVPSFAKQKIARQAQKWSEKQTFEQLNSLLDIEFRVKKGLSELKPELVNWIFKQVV